MPLLYKYEYCNYSLSKIHRRPILLDFNIEAFYTGTNIVDSVYYALSQEYHGAVPGIALNMYNEAICIVI